MNQRKAFYKQRIQESRCAWKETVNRDILIKFRNHPPKEGKEPVQSIQMSIYESNTYREDLCWLHFEVDPRVQERQRMKDKQLIQYMQVAAGNTSPEMAPVFH